MEKLHALKAKPPKYLFYNIDGDVFVSKLSEIKEVVNDLDLGEVPLQGSFTLGMSSLRGEIISVFSLGKMLSQVRENMVVNKPKIVETTEKLAGNNSITLIIEHKDLKYGLAIDSIKQVGFLESDKLKESREHALVSGYYSLDNRIATVINLELLLESQCPQT